MLITTDAYFHHGRISPNDLQRVMAKVDLPLAIDLELICASLRPARDTGSVSKHVRYNFPI